MTDRAPAFTHWMTTLVSAALLLAACSASGGGDATGGHGGQPGGASGNAGTNGGAGTGTNGGAGTGTSGSAGTGGTTGETTGGAGQTAGSSGTAAAGGQVSGSGGSDGNAGGTGGKAGTGPVDAGAGSAGSGGGGGSPDGATIMSSCVGKMIPTADPTKLGPFEFTTDKMVGPVAGAPNDPLYMDTPLHFNVYRPKDLATGGYCFPIIIWSNGHGDQPEPVSPICTASNRCGHYLDLLNQFASHGFVVVVSLSSQTSQGDPLPSMVGLDWILKQAEDPTSPYYHHLDTSHIGAAGHSEGGFTTCKMASDPRFSAASTVAGSGANPGFHEPVLLFCGGMDPTVSCTSVETTFKTITDQPAMYIDNKSTNHLNWSSQGTTGPTLSGFVAWFRVHLMNDTANRKFFYGPNCTFCSDSRVTVERNTLMMTP